MKFIITGGPCSGKTSILLAIEQTILKSSNKYFIFRETAEDLIRHYQSKGIKQPYHEIPTFQIEIAKTQEHREKVLSYLPNDVIAFLDRSIADTLAYETNPEYLKQLVEMAKHAGYEKIVFFIESLPKIYEKNDVRQESIEEARKLENKVKKVYTDLGFKMISIPPAKIEERAAKVLQFAEEYAQNRKPLKTP